jgi:hypothetical protein
MSDTINPASNADLQFVLDALLRAYKPILEDELKQTESAQALIEESKRLPATCEDEIALAESLFKRFFTTDVASRLLPVEGRQVLGNPDKWDWCYRHILCCLIFGWLVCRGPRTYRGFAYYLNLYWRCVRQALGRPVSDPPTAEEQRDFATLNRLLVQAYRPFIDSQVKDLDYPVGIPQEIQSGQIDCHVDDHATSTLFERLLMPQAAAALFGDTPIAQHPGDLIARACRCYCICALEFGCCLARARTLLEALRCVECFFACLRRCFEPLIAELNPPACSSLTMTPACVGLGVEIIGTAAGAAFTSYMLRYSLGGPIIDTAVVYPDCSAPPLHPSSSTPVTAGILGYLDTYLLPLGTTNVTVYLDVYGSGGLHLSVSAVFNFEVVYSAITTVAGSVPTFTAQDPFNPSPSVIKMVQNLLPGFTGYERSVGGSISVIGSAWADGCGNIISQYQLAQFPAPGAVPLPSIAPSPTALGGTSLIPAPVIYDGTLARPFTSCTSNVVIGGNLVADWSVCPSPPFPAGTGSLQQFDWASLPSGPPSPAPNGQRCVVFLEVDQYSITTPHTPMVVAGHDQVAVWIDNYPVVALLTQIGNVTGCGDLKLSSFVGTTAPVMGLAWDYPIDISAQQLTPNDNFGSYSLSYQKNGGCSANFLPSDYTPNGTPAGTPPIVRVPNLWTATAPTPAQAAVLASWDIVGALDGGPALPPESCTLSPLASCWQLPRGCHCAYVIELEVVDTTWVGDGGDNHHLLNLYAVNIINDITSAEYTGTVNTSGTTVTWASGMHFQPWWAAGSAINILGTTYTISSVVSATSITLTASAGSQTGVAYSYSS